MTRPSHCHFFIEISPHHVAPRLRHRRPPASAPRHHAQACVVSLSSCCSSPDTATHLVSSHHAVPLRAHSRGGYAHNGLSSVPPSSSPPLTQQLRAPATRCGASGRYAPSSRCTNYSLLALRICNVSRTVMTQTLHGMSSTSSLYGRPCKCSVRRSLLGLSSVLASDCCLSRRSRRNAL